MISRPMRITAKRKRLSRDETISGEILTGTRGALDDGIQGETHADQTLDEIFEDQMPDQNHHGEIPNGIPGENVRDGETHRGILGDENRRGASRGGEFLERESRDDHENRGFHA